MSARLAAALGLLLGIGLCRPSDARGAEPAPVCQTATWVIEPGRGVGPIDIFMTKEEVRDALGPPESVVAEDSWWYYERCGLIVEFGIDEPVVLFIDGGISPTGELLERFRARTRGGVGLGSGRGDVIQEFGESARDAELRDEHLSYPDSVYFRIRDGRVAEIKIGPPYHRRRKPLAP